MGLFSKKDSDESNLSWSQREYKREKRRQAHNRNNDMRSSRRPSDQELGEVIARLVRKETTEKEVQSDNRYIPENIDNTDIIENTKKFKNKAYKILLTLVVIAFIGRAVISIAPLVIDAIMTFREKNEGVSSSIMKPNIVNIDFDEWLEADSFTVVPELSPKILVAGETSTVTNFTRPIMYYDNQTILISGYISKGETWDFHALSSIDNIPSEIEGERKLLSNHISQSGLANILEISNQKDMKKYMKYLSGYELLVYGKMVDGKLKICRAENLLQLKDTERQDLYRALKIVSKIEFSGGRMKISMDTFKEQLNPNEITIANYIYSQNQTMQEHGITEEDLKTEIPSKTGKETILLLD